MKKAIDYIFLLRPTLLIPVWTFLLLGYYWGSGSVADSAIGDAECGVRPELDSGSEFARIGRIPHSTFLWAFLLYSLLMGGIYVFNQIMDRKTDRINQKLFLLSEGVVPVKFAYLEMGFLFFSSLLCSFFIFHFSFLTFFIFLSLLMGILYSIPPIKLKGRPFLDLLWNSVGFGFVNFSVGWFTVAPFTLSTVTHSIPYLFSVGGVFLNTTIPDLPGDKEAGDRTTGVLLGRRKTGILSTLFLLFALLSSFFVKDLVVFIVSLFSLPFFLLAVLKDQIRFYLLSIRIGAPLLVVLTIYLYPFYLLLLGVTFLSLRVYYKKRFNFTYPSIFSEK